MLLNGQPLLRYTIKQAIKSEIFDEVVVSSDSSDYLNIAKEEHDIKAILRPSSISGDLSPDIEWVIHAIDSLQLNYEDIIAILRPTSPLRSIEFIRNGLKLIQSNPAADSVRAVRLVTEHPGKMWIESGDYITPLLPFKNAATPWHSSQTAGLFRAYIQTASLEFARVASVKKNNSISGSIVMPIVAGELDALDINTPDDFELVRQKLSAISK